MLDVAWVCENLDADSRPNRLVRRVVPAVTTSSTWTTPSTLRVRVPRAEELQITRSTWSPTAATTAST